VGGAGGQAAAAGTRSSSSRTCARARRASRRRFKGEVGEQATMFFLDPSGNALEFKAFGDMSQVFAK
jgi:extradiol dioxygenase family protein